jgi:hypothetical protein
MANLSGRSNKINVQAFHPTVGVAVLATLRRRIARLLASVDQTLADLDGQRTQVERLATQTLAADRAARSRRR